MRLQRVGEIMDVANAIADARRGDPVEAVVDQRLARYAYQRLGPRRGQRPHPFAEARRHHHRAVNGRRFSGAHVPGSIHASARLSAGTCASNQARTGASAGCARSRSSRRSEEHTSELQSLMRISYAVFCLKKTNEETNK